MTKQERAINKIAKEILNLDNLKEMNCDSYDFFDSDRGSISIWGLKKALEEAYKAGQKSNEGK